MPFWYLSGLLSVTEKAIHKDLWHLKDRAHISQEKLSGDGGHFTVGSGPQTCFSSCVSFEAAVRHFVWILVQQMNSGIRSSLALSSERHLNVACTLTHANTQELRQPCFVLICSLNMKQVGKNYIWGSTGPKQTFWDLWYRFRSAECPKFSWSRLRGRGINDRPGPQSQQLALLTWMAWILFESASPVPKVLWNQEL